MNVAAGPELAAAVTNAGGLGVIGGVGYTPNVLRQQVRSLLFPLTSVPIHGCKPNYIDQGPEEGLEGPQRTIWRRSAHSPGRRQRTQDKCMWF
jgi:hypothetical protein